MIVKYDDKEKAVYVDEPLTKEIVRTIECKPPIVQKAVFHRTATVDKETYGVEAYSEWEAENSTWDRVEIAEKEGYNVSPKVVEFKEVNADTENETVSVKYEEVFEGIKIKRDEPYAKRKKKPPLPPAEENKETERTENGETSKETEKAENVEEYKETEKAENIKEPKETEKNEEVKDFKRIEINRDESYAKRKKKPPLPPAEGNEETENVKEPKEDKSDKSLNTDVFLSQFKEKTLERIAKTAELEPVNEKKTDSKTLPSTKESSLSKAKQSIISKTSEKVRQKEAFRNYQQQKYHEKMKGCVRNVRVQKPIQINDIGRFSAETIDFLNELKEIGEEALTREKWKVTLFAK